MPRSSIRRIFRAANALAEQGADVVRLDIGDPDFEMPERMVDAIKAAFDAGRTHYSPMAGLPELRKAVAAHVSAKLGLGGGGLPWERVICSQGATQALNATMQLTCDSGSAILLPSIYFPNYMQQASLAGVTPQLYPLDSSFLPILDSMADNYAPSLRAMLINSPSNPTGALFPPDTVRALYGFARQHNLWIISDEAYIDYVYDGGHLSPLVVDWEYPEAERRVLGIFSFSKSYAATGLRMGWTVCPREEVAMQLGLMNEPFTGSLTTPLQHGMVAALQVDDTGGRREALRGRRDLATTILRDGGFPVNPPAGGIFFFLDIGATGLSGDEFADTLLEKEHVAVVPGSGFGLVPEHTGKGDVSFAPNELASRCVRLCFAVPEERLRQGVERMVRFIASAMAT
ncbi:pyridoxal phosphate-dependent aminotransferase [bacterium]|nr:pyridoxal phosphate-dependent aminotransferase [bacterium]